MADQEFHIPADKLAKMAPLLVRGQIKDFLIMLDELDLNHDHKRDVAQAAKFIVIMMPFAAQANELIDFDEFAAWVCEQKFVKNKPLVAEMIKAACHAVEQG